MTNPTTTLKLQGKKFGRLFVVRREVVAGARNAMWLCQCDCGNTVVSAAANIGKTTFSCGCLVKETAANLLRGNTYGTTHNRTGTPEWRTWLSMKGRCYNPKNQKFPIYGARGIIVCVQWKDSFETFYADMGQKPSPSHSIDRKDNDGDYTPDNCHWATKKQQARNTSRNVYITIDGVEKCAAEWIEFFNLTRNDVYDRIGIKKGHVKPFKTAEAAIRHFHRHRSWPALPMGRVPKIG